VCGGGGVGRNLMKIHLHHCRDEGRSQVQRQTQVDGRRITTELLEGWV